jgi:hypothetical protein
MPTLRIARIHLGGLLAICFALCSFGVRAYLYTQSKTGLEDLSLIWYLVFVAAPLLSLGCFIAMFRVRAGSTWWLGVGLLLLLLQLFVWLIAVTGILHFI